MEKTLENKIQNKKSFILYLDSSDIFEQLTDEEAGKLIKGVLHYVHTGENPNLNRFLLMAFTPIKQALKRDLDRWRNQVKANRDNGKLGGRPKKPKETQHNPKNPSGYFNNPKNPDSVNDNDNDNNKEKIYKKEKFGEHENVLLTKDENLKLQTKLGLDVYEQCINKLSNYKKSKGKTYKSDYGAINTWVIDSIKEKDAYRKKTKGEINDEKFREDLRSKGIFFNGDNGEEDLLNLQQGI